MITKTVVFHCPKCDSTNVVKNGKNSARNQQFLCKDCGKSAVMYPKYHRSEAEKEQILSAYRERPSMRGVARLHHISRNTLKTMLQKKQSSSQLSKKACCLPKATMSLNQTKSGRLSSSKRQNIGSGQPFVAGHARLLHLCSVITAPKLANDCGTRFQKTTEFVTPLVISGMPIGRFFLRKRTGASARTQARPIIWSVGIVLYVNDQPDMFGKPYHFLKLNICIIL